MKGVVGKNIIAKNVKHHVLKVFGGIFVGGKIPPVTAVVDCHHTAMPNAGDVTNFIAQIATFIGHT